MCIYFPQRPSATLESCQIVAKGLFAVKEQNIEKVVLCGYKRNFTVKGGKGKGEGREWRKEARRDTAT